MNKKTTLSTAVGLVLGSIALGANASLTTSATLNFTLGTKQAIGCTYGTTPPCNKAAYNITDIIGSYFVMDTNGNGVEANEKTPIGSLNGIHIGTAQAASGSHSGPINGSENPNIDNPWTFFGGTGMHQTTTPTTIVSQGAGTATLNLAWSVIWNGLTETSILLSPWSTITMVCDTSSCSDGSNYTLDGLYWITPGPGASQVPYHLHLEGTISNVPVPAAIWLFGSGLFGLTAMAKRKKA